MADEKLSHSMRDDTAHGGVVSAKPGENGKAGLPLEGTPMTTGADGKLQPMPSYRTDLGKGQWWHAAWHMSTTIATPAAYAPLPAAFAALTWPGGIIVLLAGIAVTQYCSYILVRFLACFCSLVASTCLALALTPFFFSPGRPA